MPSQCSRFSEVRYEIALPSGKREPWAALNQTGEAALGDWIERTSEPALVGRRTWYHPWVPEISGAAPCAAAFSDMRCTQTEVRPQQALLGGNVRHQRHQPAEAIPRHIHRSFIGTGIGWTLGDISLS